MAGLSFGLVDATWTADVGIRATTRIRYSDGL